MEQVGDADLLSDITTRQSLRCEFDCKIYKVTCINCSLFTDTVCACQLAVLLHVVIFHTEISVQSFN